MGIEPTEAVAADDAASNALGFETIVVPAPGEAEVRVDAIVLEAEFMRIGDDLVLVAPTAEKTLVKRYFALESPPALITDSGAAVPASLAMALARSSMPAWQAQRLGALDPRPVGRVTTLCGRASAVRADGASAALAVGTSIFQGDLVETERGTEVVIAFNDDSVLTLAENARVMISAFAFDEKTAQGAATLSVLTGTFVFAAGRIASRRPALMRLATPALALTVRGQVRFGRARGGGLDTVVLLPQEPRAEDENESPAPAELRVDALLKAGPRHALLATPFAAASAKGAFAEVIASDMGEDEVVALFGAHARIESNDDGLDEEPSAGADPGEIDVVPEAEDAMAARNGEGAPSMEFDFAAMASPSPCEAAPVDDAPVDDAANDEEPAVAALVVDEDADPVANDVEELADEDETTVEDKDAGPRSASEPAERVSAPERVASQRDLETARAAARMATVRVDAAIADAERAQRTLEVDMAQGKRVSASDVAAVSAAVERAQAVLSAASDAAARVATLEARAATAGRALASVPEAPKEEPTAARPDRSAELSRCTAPVVDETDPGTAPPTVSEPCDDDQDAGSEPPKAPTHATPAAETTVSPTPKMAPADASSLASSAQSDDTLLLGSGETEGIAPTIDAEELIDWHYDAAKTRDASILGAAAEGGVGADNVAERSAPSANLDQALGDAAMIDEGFREALRVGLLAEGGEATSTGSTVAATAPDAEEPRGEPGVATNRSARETIDEETAPSSTVAPDAAADDEGPLKGGERLVLGAPRDHGALLVEARGHRVAARSADLTLRLGPASPDDRLGHRAKSASKQD